MKPKRYQDLVAECLPHIKQLFPWDLEGLIQNSPDIVLLDIREPYEFDHLHIDHSLNVPRGILESACDYGYEETVPELVEARQQQVVVICRSGSRSALAAYIMQQMGYEAVYSLQTGLRGWNDYELLLVDAAGRPVEIEAADRYFNAPIRAEQLPPPAKN